MTSSRHQPILLAILMHQNEKTTLYIEHRGLTLEISFLPDPAATPEVSPNAEYPISQEQHEAWHRGRLVVLPAGNQGL
jgi:hypothetical protein